MSAVLERLHELAQIGKGERGIDRALATPQERAARELFAAWALARDYALTQDAVGNLFARRNGRRVGALPILVGSHLDTVPTGGAYDGAYGVVAAVCALERLDETNVQTEHPVEAVAWAGEEGGRFPLGCLGSSAFAGIVPVQQVLALADTQGCSLAQALASKESGLLEEVASRNDTRAAAYLELHVEQGPVLEREGVALGIVTAIAGQRRYRVTVNGDGGHAGTVPMAQRADALCAAAEAILAVERAAASREQTVATAGRIVVEPNAPNVIPGRAIFSLDIRSTADAEIDAVEAALRDAVGEVQSRRRVHVSIERLESRLPVPMDPQLRECIARAITSLDQRAINVFSGAGHDARCLAQIVPAAMIFVPSVGGRSHVPDEETKPENLEIGVAALAASIIEADRFVL